jgi:hypothetical protein
MPRPQGQLVLEEGLNLGRPMKSACHGHQPAGIPKLSGSSWITKVSSAPGWPKKRLGSTGNKVAAKATEMTGLVTQIILRGIPAKSLPPG